jgi:hypothetical protein
MITHCLFLTMWKLWRLLTHECVAISPCCMSIELFHVDRYTTEFGFICESEKCNKDRNCHNLFYSQSCNHFRRVCFVVYARALDTDDATAGLVRVHRLHLVIRLQGNSSQPCCVLTGLRAQNIGSHPNASRVNAFAFFRYQALVLRQESVV